MYIILLLAQQTYQFARFPVLTSHPVPLDLVLLAFNWSTMGDSFFVCHHLAALYAYGYVLVSPLALPKSQECRSRRCLII